MLITTSQAAQIINLSQLRVWELIQAGELPAQRIGHAWLIEQSDAKAYARRPHRKPGRPRILERCKCKKFTVALAAKRGHKC